MNRYFRNSILWLIMLAVSMQVLASTALLRCHHHVRDHAEPAAHRSHGDPHAMMSEEHERQKYDSVGSQYDSNSHDHQKLSDAKDNCCASHCSTTCPFIFVQAFSVMHAALSSDRHFIGGEPLFSGFIPNVATRPPMATTQL